jgi:glycosyltransferase involved in cell wall biosynthesis
LNGYIKRLLALLSVRKFDVLWLEAELFPYLPALFEKVLNTLHIPYVVDYDDAIFHRYDQHSNIWIKRLLGSKINRVMKYSALVVAGNAYLAERAIASGAKKVEVIPTVVDINQYTYSKKKDVDHLIIGWIGSPATTQYLLELNDVFTAVSNICNVKIIAVGAKESMLQGSSVKVRAWSEETEVESIQRFDIGIMPLKDTLWEKGKCGYKLIQYMACGIPVVASPVGVNISIVDHGENGFLAKNLTDWENYIIQLLKNEKMRKSMGAAGLNKVVSSYSLQVQAPRLLHCLQQVVN